MAVVFQLSAIDHFTVPAPPPPPGDCDVTFPVFPFRKKEWTGMVRKDGTASNHQFGTANTAHLIRELGKAWDKVSNTPIRVGDVSLKNGVDTPDHSEHTKGYQLDIGLFITGGQNKQGINYLSPEYDFATTEKLVKMLQSNPNVKRIIFNDPKITGSKIARDKAGGTTHDNHLHVEWDDGCR